MNTTDRSKTILRTGIYLLENLTSGMYNNPLDIYREYIQNAVDSIDVSKNGINKELEVKIIVDPIARKIVIHDNAEGLKSFIAENILSSIGNSEKSGSTFRGFRGIGRLGGIAFCDKAIFKTKARNEPIESIQVWDCKGLREKLTLNRNRTSSLNKVFSQITQFSQNNICDLDSSYFEVILENVSSFRDYILDIAKIRRYLQQVAPLPFDPKLFNYAELIENKLSEHLEHYGSYKITLNGEQLYKPYRDFVRITKGGNDRVVNVDFVPIERNGSVIAFAWIGKREKMLGSIVRGDDSSGLRLRVGNICIGNEHLLDNCFREPRFNSYIIGEVHSVSKDLIPNSRRDDLVDTPHKNIFFNEIERRVGLPISKEIRFRSRKKSSETQSKKVDSHQKLLYKKPNVSPIDKTFDKNRIIEILQRKCKDCKNMCSVVDEIKNL